MIFEDNDLHSKFGIDEVYIQDNLSHNLLEKLYQRAVFSLDGEDPIIQKYTSHDIVLIFYKTVPEPSLIYRFLKQLYQDARKDDYIKSNTLINDEELFLAIKSKKFILVTHRVLVKETYSPTLK